MQTDRNRATDPETVAELERIREKRAHERNQEVARALATSGALVEVFEEDLAAVLQLWLEAEEPEERRNLWHEARALERTRIRLAMKLAPPESGEFAQLTESAGGWRRWVPFARAMLQRGFGGGSDG